MASASLQQRTPAWHAARRGKLTASNVGAALGLCTWTTRLEAYNRAMGLDTFTGNVATDWGTGNESNGILAYSAHTGNLVDDTGLHVHKYTSWLAGSPDGLIGSEGLLEVKCPYWKRKGGSRLHASVPPHYYMQMNLCLEATEREWCDFITWAPEGYKIYRVSRDKDLHDTMMPHYLKFFSAMQRMAKCPPPQSADEKLEIEQAVKQSMATHINYTFWDRSELELPPPSPEPDFDDEPCAKRSKCESSVL